MNETKDIESRIISFFGSLISYGVFLALWLVMMAAGIKFLELVFS